MSTFGFQIFDESASQFSNFYQCFSQSFGALSADKQTDLGKGGKILMPSSALEKLTSLKVDYPMVFKLTNLSRNRSTHCGVLEFTSDEGQIITPYWMMQNLLLNEGDEVKLEYCNLPTGEYVKFQPQSTEFLDISDPKTVLESAFRTFACLTKGDSVTIHYNEKCYELVIKELKPADAVVIIECDLSFEFEDPAGITNYCNQNPQTSNTQRKKELEQYLRENGTFSAFSGQGVRLDGRRPSIKRKSEIEKEENFRQVGVPNFNWKFGQLTFLRENLIEKPDEAASNRPLKQKKI